LSAFRAVDAAGQVFVDEYEQVKVSPYPEEVYPLKHVHVIELTEDDDPTGHGLHVVEKT
jgi:hypothetical protein